MRKKPRIISLYSGTGGLDYGFEAAGFETAVAVESDRDCCETLRANRQWPVIERDIFLTPTDEILDTAGLKVGEVDLLVGGPPCQPFSKSGYWAKGDTLRLKDPRAGTLGAYLRVLEESQPKAFLLENVEGLVYRKKDDGIRLLLGVIAQINARTGCDYRAVYRVLNAADYGVPQLRSRVILVATRDGEEFKFPEPTHGPAAGAGGLPYRTSWDALADVVPDPAEDLAVKGKWAELLPSIPEGKNYLYHTDRDQGLNLFGWRTRYWSFLLKLAKALPSWTIQAQPGPAIGPFHWSNRRLSVRELCRLQTFPDEIEIKGTRGAQQRQIGNAVPSLLGEVVAREVRRQFFGFRGGTSPLLVPPDRSPAPSAEPVGSVPQKFHPMAGIYAPHPGTGKGPAALLRAALVHAAGEA